MLKLKVLEFQELYDLLVDYKKENPFSEVDVIKANFKYFSLNYDHISSVKFIFFCLFSEDNKLKGYLKIKLGGIESMYYPTFKNWICAFEIDSLYRGNGYAKLLIEETFKYLQENKYDHLLQSGYSTEGFKLRTFFDEMAKKYSILFQNKDKIEF